MATYIEDKETSHLIAEYARLQNKTKTQALRDLLRDEIAKQKDQESPEEIYRRMKAYLGSHPRKKIPPVTKETFDRLYEYLDGD